jgi:hypothetical protein
MGHYLSEMWGPDDDRRENEKAKGLAHRVEYIRADIAARGVEHVLADIVTDPTMYSIRSCR